MARALHELQRDERPPGCIAAVRIDVSIRPFRYWHSPDDAMDESQKRVGTVGTLGRFIHEIRMTSPRWQRADKGMFDLGDIAALIDPAGTATWESVEAPGVRQDLTYDFAQKHGTIVRIKTIDRDASFKLLDRSLQRIARHSKPGAQ
jgi:hypothetical protein